MGKERKWEKREKGKELSEQEHKEHLIAIIFLLITANFPLGSWERALVSG